MLMLKHYQAGEAFLSEKKRSLQVCASERENGQTASGKIIRRCNGTEVCTLVGPGAEVRKGNIVFALCNSVVAEEKERRMAVEARFAVGFARIVKGYA